MFKTLKKLSGISIERSSDSKSVELFFDGKRKYSVFADGTIKFFRYGHNYRAPEEGLSAGQVTKNGYNMVSINGELFYRHRVVAELYLIGDANNLCINHKDGDKLNNHVDNLEWTTYSENHKHAYKVLKRKTVAGQDRGGGVCFDKSRQKWMAYTDMNRKRTYIGRFNSEEQARIARERARIDNKEVE